MPFDYYFSFSFSFSFYLHGTLGRWDDEAEANLLIYLSVHYILRFSFIRRQSSVYTHSTIVCLGQTNNSNSLQKMLPSFVFLSNFTMAFSLSSSQLSAKSQSLLHMSLMTQYRWISNAENFCIQEIVHLYSHLFLRLLLLILYPSLFLSLTLLMLPICYGPDGCVAWPSPKHPTADSLGWQMWMDVKFFKCQTLTFEWHDHSLSPNPDTFIACVFVVYVRLHRNIVNRHVVFFNLTYHGYTYTSIHHTKHICIPYICMNILM